MHVRYLKVQEQTQLDLDALICPWELGFLHLLALLLSVLVSFSRKYSLIGQDGHQQPLGYIILVK